MHRDLVLIALLGALVGAEGRVCPSMDIRNVPSHLEKLRNCTLIMGHLRIVLFDYVSDPGVFADYSFPELEVIEDHLIFFRISQLRTIGTLFPNLRVIRGNKLFYNHALIVYRMSHLEEIGLSSLQHIGHGSVKIDHCPHLCFADTIDWQALGATALDFYKTTTDEYCENKSCPRECGGHCWNTATCQKMPDAPNNCHPQCIGCTRDHSAKHCLSCRYYEDDGECVERCPSSKVTNHYAMICLTKRECEELPRDGTWWVFNNTCIQTCPVNYERDETVKDGCVFVDRKHCNGTVIDTLAILEAFAGCTHIDHSLDIRISVPLRSSDLEDNLGQIVSINGYLKIGRSSAIRSLEFFKQLRLIKGEVLENQKYALFVFENQNLQRLWNFTHDFNLTIERGVIAFHDNPQLCLSEIEKMAELTEMNSTTNIDISKYSNGYRAACNPKSADVRITETNPTNVTLTWHWLEAEVNDTIIGYTVYYVEAMKGNVTTFENKDACDAESWDSVFVHNNSVQLKYLAPYTRYGYYIKALSAVIHSEQTPIYYFNTSSDDPTEPVDIIAKAKNESTIVLSWLPPKLLNGKLSYYLITMYLQEDHISLLEERDYCRFPHRERGIQVYSKPKTPTSTSTLDCPCLKEDQYNIFNTDQVCGIINDCKIFFYRNIQDKPSNNTTEEKLIVQKRFTPEPMPVLDNINQTFRQINKTDVSVSRYEVTDLRHFSVYIFFLSACNEKKGDREQCSAPEMVFQRTNKSERADRVEKFRITVKNADVYVNWQEPSEVNSMIVSYQIEVRRVDLEHAKIGTECVTRKQYHEMDSTYRLSGLSPGNYSIRVRANSLAGPGKFSEWKFFEIIPPKYGMYWIYGLLTVVSLMVIALGAYIGRYWYRRKYALDSNHLITSINPDYAGPVYVEDEWEIDRSDIEIIKELGQGSFGMVYQGMIKSKRYPCAIKTISESASMPSRMEFLNEGAVMKTFNTHHVIKLLGIVSRGQPPLVVMELMERGDLKSYLRRCREPSQNLTTNEMYRMGAEIADGMAYLAAKKFVHRDLAARNCMVAADRTVKIGDFGMARDIYETDYYRKETMGLLPVRWMAPESLADGIFTSDADVWSYGIVLWEMATLAEQPYQGLSNEEVFHHVKNKGRLERPPECSDLLYEVMDACWLWRPNDRPTFADIVDKLAGHVGQDFRLVAFCYSRQGRELALNAGPRVYNPPAMIVAPDEDFFGRYDASEEEVSLYVKEPSRPTKFLPLSSQRFNKSSPYQISPGSPSSTFSLNSS